MAPSFPSCTVPSTNSTALHRFIIVFYLVCLQYSPTTVSTALMKAWACHGRTQKDLVANLCEAQIIRSPEVRQAMEKVDRRFFCPNQSYRDAPQPIGKGQTISAPHMHAHALEQMLPHLRASSSPKLHLLDVGCGSGYLTACMGEWVASGSLGQRPGSVYGIDVVSDLVTRSTRNIERSNPALLSSQTVQLGIADGWKGLPQTFDAIHVGAAAADFPVELLQQLKVGGVMVIPVGPQDQTQTLYKIERQGNSGNGFDPREYTFQALFGVRYVPLVHP